MKTKLFFIVASFSMLIYTSCTKDSSTIDQTSIDLIDDNSVTDVAFDDVFNTVDNATSMLDDVLSNGLLKSASIATDSCPSVTVDITDPDVWPKTITIDYGTGCTGFNGSTRSGKIIITLTGRRSEVDASRTVEFDNFYFNGIKVEGEKVITNLGPNENQNVEFSVVLTGGKLTLPDGKTIERSINHKREWIAGFATKTIWDDECLVTGTATGKNIDGVTYTNTIITALHWKRVCEFLVSGVIRFERDNAESVDLDYGQGECDAVATLTMGDMTKEITLRHRHRLLP